MALLRKSPGPGRANPTGNRHRGLIDEVRIEYAARPADWIAADYLTMTDAFLAYGQVTQQSIIPEPITMLGAGCVVGTARGTGILPVVAISRNQRSFRRFHGQDARATPTTQPAPMLAVGLGITSLGGYIRTRKRC